MSGAIPPLPQYAFMVWCLVKAQGQIYFYLFLPDWVFYELCKLHNVYKMSKDVINSESEQAESLIRDTWRIAKKCKAGGVYERGRKSLSHTYGPGLDSLELSKHKR
jgi:hypothetical protein